MLRHLMVFWHNKSVMDSLVRPRRPLGTCDSGSEARTLESPVSGKAWLELVIFGKYFLPSYNFLNFNFCWLSFWGFWNFILKRSNPGSIFDFWGSVGVPPGRSVIQSARKKISANLWIIDQFGTPAVPIMNLSLRQEILWWWLRNL